MRALVMFHQNDYDKSKNAQLIDCKSKRNLFSQTVTNDVQKRVNLTYEIGPHARKGT